MVMVCCLNPRPPTTAPPTTATLPPLLARPKREMSWRSQCVVGMAIAMVGLPIVIGTNDHVAFAADSTVVVAESKNVKRWSNKRICPAWQLNSLETIVPEDLPRPSAKRRWESVGDDYRHSRHAPPVKASNTTIISSHCYSM